MNLPIGSYLVVFTRDGFATARFPSIRVQSGGTTTLPAKLEIGSVSNSVTVEADPLLNATDTTNGYTLESAQIQAAPLPTGSFTGLAILSPGVNAELPGGTGLCSPKRARVLTQTAGWVRSGQLERRRLPGGWVRLFRVQFLFRLAPVVFVPAMVSSLALP